MCTGKLVFKNLIKDVWKLHKISNRKICHHEVFQPIMYVVVLFFSPLLLNILCALNFAHRIQRLLIQKNSTVLIIYLDCIGHERKEEEHNEH